MPDRTNVNDALFPNDNIFNDDYERDINAGIEDHRNVILDYYTTAIIFQGLTIEAGTNPDTVMVRAGRAADIDGYRIIVPLDVDNIATLDATGNPNYIAVRHVWAYSGADLPAKAGAVTYNRIRSDDYEINVALIQQAEAAGWVLLGYAYKTGGVWYFVVTVPTYRSRNARINTWSETWGYPGAIPLGGPNSMYHHGVQGADVYPETSVLIQRMQVSLLAAPAGGTISFQLLVNGIVPPWPTPLGITVPIASTYEYADIDQDAQEVTFADYLDIAVTGNAGLVGGGNAFCRVSGTVMSGI